MRADPAAQTCGTASRQWHLREALPAELAEGVQLVLQPVELQEGEDRSPACQLAQHLWRQESLGCEPVEAGRQLRVERRCGACSSHPGCSFAQILRTGTL